MFRVYVSHNVFFMPSGGRQTVQVQIGFIESFQASQKSRNACVKEAGSSGVAMADGC